MIPIIQRPSPNFNARRDGLRPQIVVLHFTALANAEEAIAFLSDPAREVSAHYVIARDGTINQLVHEMMRAWHAGASYWRGLTDVNSASIGIELDNNGGRPFDEPQYAALIKLLRDIIARQNIAPENVLGHSDVSPGRKFDPGPWFDWQRLYDAGVSAPPKGVGRDLRARLTHAGYNPAIALDPILTSLRIRNGATPFFGDARPGDFDLLA